MKTYRNVTPLQFAEVFMLGKNTINKRSELLNGDNEVEWTFGTRFDWSRFRFKPVFTQIGESVDTPFHGPGTYLPPKQLRKYLGLSQMGLLQLQGKYDVVDHPYDWFTYGMDNTDGKTTWLMVEGTGKHHEFATVHDLLAATIGTEKPCWTLLDIERHFLVTRARLNADIAAQRPGYDQQVKAEHFRLEANFHLEQGIKMHDELQRELVCKILTETKRKVSHENTTRRPDDKGRPGNIVDFGTGLSITE